MKTTVLIKLLPTSEQRKQLIHESQTFIETVNRTIIQMLQGDIRKTLSSKDIQCPLNSSVKSEIARCAMSVVKKYHKSNDSDYATLRKPYISWNNQNYTLNGNAISCPFWINGKSKKITFKAVITKEQKAVLASHKLGNLRITQKSNKWIAQIAIERTPLESKTTIKIMGVDLGLKVPAVSVDETGNTKFYGNGRENKYMKRKHRSKRQELGRKKKPEAIVKLNNKEQRWMKDKDHKISRQIVNHAIDKDISTIRIEQLANIRETTRTSRKNEKNLHTWSFYRLSQYIEYKAKLSGIKVEYVNPKYTSQHCPNCSKRNKANDRRYFCSCGFKSHRDIVGAMNIISAPVVSDKRKSA